jgi:hypothetical protein
MRKSSIFLALLCFLALASCASAGVLDTLQSPAELSNWDVTTSSAQVQEYLEVVVPNSGGRIRYETIGYSTYGKPIPLCIVGIPIAPTDPSEVGDRIVVWIHSGVHSGEIEGKEALLIFLREIAQGKHDNFLKDAVLLLCPNFGPDGNDFLGTWRSSSQPTPRLVGTRWNGQGYNMNRDWVRLAAPETSAAMKIHVKWDPAVIVDSHATNGSRHRMPLLYGFGNNTNNYPEFERANLLYALSVFAPDSTFHKNMLDVIEEATNNKQVVTSNDTIVPQQSTYVPSYCESPSTATFTGRIEPGVTEILPTVFVNGSTDDARYGTSLPTLKNRLALLLECHSHNYYKYRKDVQYQAFYSLIDQAIKQKASIKALFKSIDDKAKARAAADNTLGAVVHYRGSAASLDYDLGAGMGMISVDVFRRAINDSPNSGDRTSSTFDFSTAITVAVENRMRYIPVAGQNTPLGALYIFEPAADKAAALLIKHGVEVMRLKEDVVVSKLEQFCNPSYSSGRAVWAWQNYLPQTAVYEGQRPIATQNISADWFERTDQIIPAGYYVVSTAQPLGNFIGFMIEPKTNDGLCFWNFYDTPGVSTERNGSTAGICSFDLRKTDKYSAIPASALEIVKVVASGNPTTEAEDISEPEFALPTDVQAGIGAALIIVEDEAQAMLDLAKEKAVEGADKNFYLKDPLVLARKIFDPTKYDVPNAISLPMFRFGVTDEGKVGAITLIGIEGSSLLADTAKDIKLLAALNTGGAELLSIVYNPADLGDGKFLVSTESGYILKPGDPITSYNKFNITVGVKDNGKYDLLTAPMVIGSSLFIAKADEVKPVHGKTSGGGGCMMSHISILLALALVPIFVKKRK